MRSNLRNIAAAVAVTFATPLAHASVDYFLKIDGIDGESTDERHKGQIEVLSWSVGASRDATSKNKPCVRDITITKVLDKATPILFVNAVSGMTIPNATLVARKSAAGAAGGQEYFVMTLKDVVVTSVQDGGSTEGTPVEQISLAFGSLTLQYKPQRDDGSLGPAVQSTVKGGC
jgi:type VI secretion system secreted protein Hcp